MAIGTVTRLTLIKSFNYRGNPEEFSNTYAFKGPPPGDDASWTVLMNDVISHEKQVLHTSVHYSRAYGYDSNDPTKHHVFAHDFTVPGPPPPGTWVGGTGNYFAGDQASCVWWKLDRLSDKGKPTYLRKYFHAGQVIATAPDELDPAYLTVLNAFAQGVTPTLHGGMCSPGGPKDSDPDPGGNIIASGVIPYVTTRTLKRRGKRPKTGN